MIMFDLKLKNKRNSNFNIANDPSKLKSLWAYEINRSEQSKVEIIFQMEGYCRFKNSLHWYKLISDKIKLDVDKLSNDKLLYNPFENLIRYYENRLEVIEIIKNDDLFIELYRNYITLYKFMQKKNSQFYYFDDDSINKTDTITIEDIFWNIRSITEFSTIT